MKKNVKQIWLIAVMAVTLFGFSLFHLVKPSDRYSLSERRVLAQRPTMTAETVLSGRFQSDFESYTLDQFPLRDSFRHLKAAVSSAVFHRKDNNGLYLQNGYLSKLDYPLSVGKLNRNTQKLRSVYETYLKDTNCTLYTALIPDKNIFLAPLGGYPAIDYDQALDAWTAALDYATPISLDGTLTLDSFYFTDQHWRQEKLLPVAQRLVEGMGTLLTDTYTENLLDVPFYGAYVGQSARSVPPEDLYYLTSDLLGECTVTSWNTGKPVEKPLYDMEAAHGRDPYELFLCGSDPLVTLENPNAGTDRELVVFRDSFSSSLIPLLASGYSKITLVDLRYMQSGILGRFIDFQSQDVLFLYSTLVLNNTLAQ